MILTSHAKIRCIQRRISVDDIRAVLSMGHEVRSSEHYRILQRGKLFVVMSNDDNAVVTVFRKMGIKRLLKKQRQNKRRWRREGLHSPRF